MAAAGNLFCLLAFFLMWFCAFSFPGFAILVFILIFAV